MASVVGDVEMMPLSDIVAWLANRSYSGTLTVRRRDAESRFTVREGVCTQAASTDPREYLGQHLINFGYIDEDQLQRAFDTQKETRVPLGRVLVMVEALTQEQLQRVLTFKTREGLLEALCWTEGQWKLVAEVDADRELDCLRPVDLREVCSEAVARQNMWAEIRRVFPTDATRVDVVPEPQRPESPFDRRLLALMDGGKTVGEAALELRAMDFQTYARLYDLANRNLVRPRVTTSDVSFDAFAQLAILQGFAAAAAPPSLSPKAPSNIFPRTASAGGMKGLGLSASLEVSAASAGASSSAAPAPATSSGDAPPPRVVLPGRTATPGVAFTGPGSYIMVKPEKATERPGVRIPAEAANPEQALREALAGRSWADALTISQRILEQDPLNTEAIAGFRVADAQVRKLGEEPGVDADMSRAPRLAMAREEVALAHLTSKERYVLSRVDGARTLQQIAAVSPISRVELVRIVDGFVARGVLTY